MKLLLDQNISFRLVKKIERLFPGTEQVKKLNLTDSSDLDIWRFAKTHNFSMLTFDSDFYDLNTLYGVPPKIIWIRSNNLSTENIALLISKRIEIITEYLNDSSPVGCLQLID